MATTVVAAIVNGIWGDNVIWDAVGPGIAQLPDSVTATPDFSLLGNFSLGFFSTLGFWTAVVPVFAVMLSDFFDTMVRRDRGVPLLLPEGRTGLAAPIEGTRRIHRRAGP